MITPADVLLWFEMLAASGLRVPDAHLRPESEGIPSGRDLAIRAYAGALAAAGVTRGEAEAAVFAYIAEPDAGQYPKAWPDPGKLIARTPTGRAAVYLASSADGDTAFADFWRRLAALAFRPDRDEPARHLDPDTYRNAAMFHALAVVGGIQACRMLPSDDPAAMGAFRKRWTSAYLTHREGQRRDPDAVRSTVRALSAPALPAPRRIGAAR